MLLRFCEAQIFDGRRFPEAPLQAFASRSIIMVLGYEHVCFMTNAQQRPRLQQRFVTTTSSGCACTVIKAAFSPVCNRVTSLVI
jgi:hypothetical protein